MKLWKFDNFLKKQTADHIEKEISTDDFPWYYLSSSCADDADFSLMRLFKTIQGRRAREHPCKWPKHFKQV